MTSLALRPEEKKEQVITQLAETARILNHLAERRDMPAESFEMELRMQLLWLANAANVWHEAGIEELQIQRWREHYLKREGPGQ